MTVHEISEAKKTTGKASAPKRHKNGRCVSPKALLVALSGFLGGLVMSAIKRDRGVKDWSQFIPGHGGMLDRLDSLCLSAPLFYHLTRACIGT